MMNTYVSRQKGMVLIISLIFLVMLTLIGLSGIRTTTIEEKMAGNSRDLRIAFLSAETALRDAENWLLNQNVPSQGTNNGAGGVWSKNMMDPDPNNNTPWWQERDVDWWTNNAIQYRGQAINQVRTRPRYIIEYVEKYSDSLDSNNDKITEYFYRITAFGTGASNQSRVLLQSTYFVKW